MTSPKILKIKKNSYKLIELNVKNDEICELKYLFLLHGKAGYFLANRVMCVIIDM